MALWTIFLMMCAFTRGYGTDGSTHPHTFYGCCEDGKQRARTLTNCNDLPYISHSHVCRLAQEQCCTTVVEERLCEAGASMAAWQGACEGYFFLGKPWENKIAKGCCDCCMLGMASVDQDLSCEMTYMSLGKLCDHVAKRCCAGNYTEGLNSTAEVYGPTVPPESQVPPSITVPLVAADNCTVTNCSQRCIDNSVCACYVGYRLRRDGTTCEDMNECLLNVHDCVAGQMCINTQGSFRCQRETGCGTGYELTDSNDCRDIDECALNIHNCGLSFECANSEGSFRCYPKEKCAEGFIQDAVGNCIDINECVAHPVPCQPGHTCVNTQGSFVCRRSTIACGRGYHLNAEGTRCEDVDECQTGEVCRNHGCVNMVGTYRCNCNNGFVFNSLARLCEDINECRYYPKRLCAHKCINTEGSYECSCSAGFQLSLDGRNCEDVNECEDSPCSQECANVYGSYQCYCNHGYQLSDADGITCEDIDECGLPTGSQVCAYQCFNAPGSFYCACPSVGYTLASNGRTCQDIDECATGSHSCGATQACFNIHGGYRCLVFECPSYYRQQAHGRCKRVTCEFTRDPASCMSLPLRIAFYNVTLPANTPVPADIFRMGPSKPVPGEEIKLSIASGDEWGYFAAHGGVVSLRRAVTEPLDFFLTVELRLTRFGTSNLYVAKIAVFVTQVLLSQPSRAWPS
ncbi:fibulin-1-like isoform X3 [Phycodurus eques]|uniref:fibulin-1-like isoform X3 n=1 Tax=Phycodurus eques TaxID=693459 RepID=UPI002ACD5C99|nr:fibulin-1-like isoform X3 [Phycodurus eques]